ncbi:glycosyltransferase [Schaalia sp. JY-X159]|uniref:glycosyltransferase n=1 Tax=Schaalia sp. JY-X159 TaxID=2758575 RepID=UPI00165EB09A|nr:glycosyltransferase [Schaalia sp. JY-X159]
MRILILAAPYAPHNSIGAVRTSKFAEYWSREGHDVHVITREPTIFGLEEPLNPGISVQRIKDPLGKASTSGAARVRSSSHGSAKQVVLSGLQSVARSVLWPDRHVMWSARTLFTPLRLPWKPDVVVVSVGPVSALAPARRIAQSFGVPLVVDYRDLISDRGTFGGTRVSPRQWLTLRFECAMRSYASLFTAVTKPMVDLLESKTGTPTVLITNGYEPRDFEGALYAPTEKALVIRYVGTIYAGLYDLTPLFQAIRRLRDTRADLSVRVEFYGADSHEVRALAEELGVSDSVEFRGRVSHVDAVQAQVQSDVLLLIFGGHPREKGVLTGKLFEYLGAQRPILCIGLTEGEAPDLIRDRDLGFVSSDPQEIVEFLLGAAHEKSVTGAVKYHGRVDSLEHTRETQSLRMLESLERLVCAAETTND